LSLLGPNILLSTLLTNTLMALNFRFHCHLNSEKASNACKARVLHITNTHMRRLYAFVSH
jgi:hypothetical protein